MMSSIRRSVLIGAQILVLALSLTPVRALAQALYQFDLPTQALSDTLRAIGSKSGINVAFDPSAVRGRTAPALSGSYTGEDAIKRVLEGTGLIMREVKDGSVLIVDPSATQGSASNEEPNLQEVLVTAQKSVQLAQDVPIALTVLNAQSLIGRNDVSLDDYYTQVPGLSLLDDGNGFKLLAIRGITTGANNTPTVGIYVDDTPVGSSTALARGDVLVPDLDPADLEQIEVLKGPQGTLYGASNMGGLLKYETIQPNLTNYSAYVETDGADVDHGSAGWGFRGNVNLPLVTDVFALRISGSERYDPGYIDNVATGKTNVNTHRIDSGRIAALWAPLEDLTVKLSAYVSDRNAYGSGREDYNFLTNQPIYGDLTHNQIPGTGTNNSTLHLFNLTVNDDFSKFSVLSSTSYAHVNWQSNADISPLFGFFGGIFGIPDFGATIYQHYGTEKFTQEFRVASRGDNLVDWLVGAFYTHEVSIFVQNLDGASTIDGGPIPGLPPLSDGVGNSEYKEAALFGDLTYHITSSFDVQGGLRYSKNWQNSLNLSSGLLGNPGVTVGQGDSSQGVTTFLFSPTYKLDRNDMIYGRIASGYRAGGPNYTLQGYEYPFGSDKSTNYEVGYKGELLDHALTLDADVFYISWKNIQLLGSDANDQSFFSNAGSAISKGAEFAGEYRPLRGLTLGLSAAYTDAYLNSTAPAGIYALPGFRLPYSSRWSGRASADYEFPIVGDWKGDFGGDYSYVGERESDFTADAATPRVALAPYRLLNFHTGISVGHYAFSLYVKNAVDERGIISASPLTLSKTPADEGIAVIQPRTVGITASARF
jgi:outer membrane receptor protein involved in Fe transport